MEGDSEKRSSQALDTEKADSACIPAPMLHCPCDVKADVNASGVIDHTFVAKSRAYNTTSEFDDSLHSALLQVLPNVSLRAEAMLIAFCGINIGFYVGGE
jgi:hypothetical protein